MASSVNDKFKKAGAGTVTTLSAPGKALGATSINVGSTTNYPSDTGIIIAIRTVDASGKLVAGTYTEYSATVSSATSLAIVATPVYGNDQIYAAGSTTQVFIPTSAYANNSMVDGILVQHKQDGKHADTITTNTINENTAGNGVTVDGLNIKDGKLNTNDSVGTANIADDAVTPPKAGDLAKLVNRQNDTTNTVVTDQLVQTGWGQIAGTGASYVSEAITFPVAFDSAPIVLVGNIGSKATSQAANIGDFGVVYGFSTGTINVTTTGFTVGVYGTPASGSYYGYTWIAIGTKAR